MPLIRSAAAPARVLPDPVEQPPLQRLDSADANERRRAARDLAGDASAIEPLAARLAVETVPNVRASLFSSLVAIGGATVAGRIAPLVHSEDANLRGGAIEALQRLADDAAPAVDALLADADADTRLLAIEVTRAWPAGLAEPRLRRIIEADPHVNVCGAAVDVATEAGTAALLAPLAALGERFPAEQFLAFAIDIATARIKASSQGAR